MVMLSIDPGRGAKPSIGWCLWSGNGDDDWREIERGEMTWDDLCRKLKLTWIEDHKFCEEGCPDYSLEFDGWWIEEVVIEDFINDPGVSRGGQRNGTSEVIGAVEILCVQSQTPITRQRSSILTTAKLHSGYELPINPRTKKPVSHLPHQDAAYLHGFEYLLSRGRVKVAPLDL